MNGMQKSVNPLISVMDRTGLNWPDLNCKVLFPMPYNLHAVDFYQASANRITEITNREGLITILWSGGIDSTYIFCLMLETGIAQRLSSEGRLCIALNADSIRENPNMYNNIIKKGFFNCVVQSDRVLDNPHLYPTIITGEMADNLVGSLTMKSCVDYYNDFSVVHEDWRQRGIEWFVRNRDSAETTEVRNLIDAMLEKSPIEIKTSHDLFWYLNFNLKWQAVNFRIASHAKDNPVGNSLINNLVHFFNTEEFQIWSLTEGHYFEGTSWSDYKRVMKKKIFDVTNDADYFKYKTKYPSLPGLLRYKDTFDFIYQDGDNYQFSKTLISLE
jgi:hypothetical protein